MHRVRPAKNTVEISLFSLFLFLSSSLYATDPQPWLRPAGASPDAAASFSSETNDFQTSKPNEVPEDTQSFNPSEKQASLEKTGDGSFSTVTLTPYHQVLEELDPFMLKEQFDMCPRALLYGVRKLDYIAHHQLPASHAWQKTALKKALLLGPPGSGKSSLAKTIAYRLKRPYLFITAASVCNEYKDSGIANLKRIFTALKKAKIPCVIIFDEITSLTDKFKNDNSNIGLVDVFWTELDQLDKEPHILFVATANDIEKLPATLKDRFGKHIYDIPLPEVYARQRMLDHYLPQEISPQTIANIAAETDGLSLRELWDVIKMANVQESSLRSATPEQETCTPEDLEKACVSVLLQHKTYQGQAWWEKHKQKLQVAAPIVLQMAAIVIGIGLQWYSMRKSMAIAAAHHLEQMAFQRRNVAEQMAFQVRNANESLDLQAEIAQIQMQFQADLHNQNSDLQMAMNRASRDMAQLHFRTQRSDALNNHQDTMSLNRDMAQESRAQQERLHWMGVGLNLVTGWVGSGVRFLFSNQSNPLPS